MNLDNNPTMEQLRDLFRACDDRYGRHIAWVDRNGEVRIEPVPGGDVPGFVRGHTDLKMWLRVFEPGHDYVGPGAAEDTGWVEDVFRALTREWAKARNRTAIMAVEDW
ncbi:hypothetical protein [Frigoriglobus tundricola]|uniref:Uncharacterized protein n=1 Tax=Frigoriglobus tundricola TaxID=2774151 RepID=A0A6M5YWY7_9BACT|nr:hypothetical protein [Frigoriglobus tundricola]QJW97452.1 hypothetical protein FTUN_5026 [Frigoriglobus tundricola]